MSLEQWSFVGQVVETILIIALLPLTIWQFSLQRKATQDQTNATLIQVITTIISWVQSEDIRTSRRLLYSMERKHLISQLLASEWKKEWKQAADRVSQCFNSAAIVAMRDERLNDFWIRPTSNAILKSWTIVQPRLVERRQEEHNLWREFDWLAAKARQL